MGGVTCTGAPRRVCLCVIRAFACLCQRKETWPGGPGTGEGRPGRGGNVSGRVRAARLLALRPPAENPGSLTPVLSEAQRRDCR